jgi:sigma-B regulation protein RsbU (phosphoserine phosphatase)
MRQRSQPGTINPEQANTDRAATNGRPIPAPGHEAHYDATRELAKLSRTQRQMLPQSAPEIRGYRLQLVYRPAYMATGDYHDFFHRADGSAAAFIGDSAGHGPSASMLVATMRAILHTHPELHGEPGNTLTMAGRFLHALFPSDLFMTGVYLRFGKAGQVSWACAGQDPPLRVSRLGKVARVDLTATGLPMGIDINEVYETVSWRLIPGERLVLFTDGLVEARNEDGEPFGRRRLQSYLRKWSCLPLDRLVREVVQRAINHQQGAGFEDDFTILGVELRARG